jgi:hypothetical protein
LKKTQKTRTEKGVTGRFCVAWYTHFSAWFCFQILIFVFYSTTVYACTTNFYTKMNILFPDRVLWWRSASFWNKIMQR